MTRTHTVASMVLVAMLALAGCSAPGLTEKTDAEYRLACYELGGSIREVSTPQATLQCVFNFPDLPKRSEQVDR